MLSKLIGAWRARRVLIVGGERALGPWLSAFLGEIGARPRSIAPDADAQALCRAMSEGRVSAVIVPALHQLRSGDVQTQLAALDTLLTEIREAGVPLAIFCSDADVYRGAGDAWYAREEDGVGGQTREGLVQSILQLYADGISRGLLGDAVTALIVRHMPCLGCGAPAAAQYDGWCSALMNGDVAQVEHPGMQGVFLHPLDAACGVLALGARFLGGEELSGGVYNLGAGPQNLCANRSAALRFVSRHGGKRPVSEREPPRPAHGALLLDGAKARLLCGARCQIPGDEALSLLLAWRQAQARGEGAGEIMRQTQAYMERIR